MNLQEKLEVIAADLYTKAMAVRTTIQILKELEPKKEIKKKKKKKVYPIEKLTKVHWTRTKKGKEILRKRALVQKPWLHLKQNADKNNKRTG